MAKALQVSASTISRDVAALLAQGFLVIPWVSANLDQTGAISPFIWWHNGEWGGLEEIWSEIRGWRGMEFFSGFWAALKREQTQRFKQLRGV